MLKTKGYAAMGAQDALVPFEFTRREPGNHDVLIQIQSCGICHSDIHQARNEWKQSIYPMVPGHEIIGRVVRTGAGVKQFQPGETVGVGCFVDACKNCAACHDHEEQFCEKHCVKTYNDREMDGKTPTFGGYSSQIVVNEDFILRIPPHLPVNNAAPLLCAGITTYSPLKKYGVEKGTRVAVAGLGGLGHMAVKLAAAMGAHVTILSHSPAKEKDAKRLGAAEFVVTKEPGALDKLAGRFDFLLDTISAPHNTDQYLALTGRGGSMVVVGVPEKPLTVNPFSLIAKRRQIAGSLIGGIQETQEMLDFCGKHNISADVEVITPDKINEAYERTLRGDVRYRFVIDMAAL